ncbi:MAG: flotillin family protein [Candidatus Thermoplasmatota archaeon]|nr:flotillin family protein [Candidatus Thermoplasmatota archaeon]
MEEGVMLLVATLAIIAGVFAPIVLYSWRYKKAPPDKAMVVYGKSATLAEGYRIIIGGAKFIVPLLEEYAFIPLDVRNLELAIKDVQTNTAARGAEVDVRAIAHVKVSNDPELLDVAAGQLLHKTDEEINEIAAKALEGQIYHVFSALTLEQIDGDREGTAQRIQEKAAAVLKEMGMEVRSFAIRKIEWE